MSAVVGLVRVDVQSTGTPWVYNTAAELRNWLQPPLLRRRVPVTMVGSVVVASRRSWTLMAMTGWVLISMSWWCPSLMRVVPASTNWTVWRRFRYQ